jgi:hypothetical protein
MAAGAFTIANNYLPGAGHLNIAVLNAIGLSAIAFAVVARLLPWRRWPPSAPILLAPIAFGLIALGNRFGGVSHYSFAVYFVLAFTWVGSPSRRGRACSWLPSPPWPTHSRG